MPERAQRPVAYAAKRELIDAIRKQRQGEGGHPKGGLKSTNEVN